jgi:hypothetical protein
MQQLCCCYSYDYVYLDLDTFNKSRGWEHHLVASFKLSVCGSAFYHYDISHATHVSVTCSYTYRLGTVLLLDCF